ncbi:35894_t:CDS:1, partial [Gigaspora margarita]
DIAASRAFMLRIVKKEGWIVAANIRDPFDKDPMEAFFQKNCLVPDSWQKISSRVNSKSKVSVSSFSNLSGGQALPVLVQKSERPIESILEFPRRS